MRLDRRRYVKWAVGAAVVGAVVATMGCTATAGPTGTGPIAEPPSPGSVTSTVAVPDVGPPVKVRLKDTADLAGIQVSIDSFESAEVKSQRSGEGSGPALTFIVRVKNATGADYRTEQFQASLIDAKGNAATPITDFPATRLPAVLGPGGEDTAKVVFLLAKNVRQAVSLEVTVAAGVQSATFTGDAS